MTGETAIETVENTSMDRPTRRRWWVALGVVAAAACIWAITDDVIDSHREHERKEQERQGRIDKLTETAEREFKVLVDGLDQEAVPGVISIAAPPVYVDYIDSVSRDNLDGGVVNVSFGRCEKQYYIPPDDKEGNRMLGYDEEYASYTDEPRPFAIIQDRKIIGWRPYSEEALLATFPPECAANPEEARFTAGPSTTLAGA